MKAFPMELLLPLTFFLSATPAVDAREHLHRRGAVGNAHLQARAIAVSGVDSNGYCLFANTDARAGGTPFAATTVAACQAICTNMIGCQSFTFTGTLCYASTSKASASAFGTANGFTAGSVGTCAAFNALNSIGLSATAAVTTSASVAAQVTVNVAQITSSSPAAAFTSSTAAPATSSAAAPTSPYQDNGYCIFPNMDARSGGTGYAGTSVAACETICNSVSCQAFTFTGNTCWISSSAAPVTAFGSANGYTAARLGTCTALLASTSSTAKTSTSSSVPATTSSAPTSPYNDNGYCVFPNTDARSGGSPVAGTSVTACETACTAVSCTAWTFTGSICYIATGSTSYSNFAAANGLTAGKLGTCAQVTAITSSSIAPTSTVQTTTSSSSTAPATSSVIRTTPYDENGYCIFPNTDARSGGSPVAASSTAACEAACSAVGCTAFTLTGGTCYIATGITSYSNFAASNGMTAAKLGACAQVTAITSSSVATSTILPTTSAVPTTSSSSAVAATSSIVHTTPYDENGYCIFPNTDARSGGSAVAGTSTTACETACTAVGCTAFTFTGSLCYIATGTTYYSNFGAATGFSAGKLGTCAQVTAAPVSSVQPATSSSSAAAATSSVVRTTPYDENGYCIFPNTDARSGGSPVSASSTAACEAACSAVGCTAFTLTGTTCYIATGVTSYSNFAAASGLTAAKLGSCASVTMVVSSSVPSSTKITSSTAPTTTSTPSSSSAAAPSSTIVHTTPYDDNGYCIFPNTDARSGGSPVFGVNVAGCESACTAVGCTAFTLTGTTCYIATGTTSYSNFGAAAGLTAAKLGTCAQVTASLPSSNLLSTTSASAAQATTTTSATSTTLAASQMHRQRRATGVPLADARLRHRRLFERFVACPVGQKACLVYDESSATSVYKCRVRC